jgi:hypothetical protein
MPASQPPVVDLGWTPTAEDVERPEARMPRDAAPRVLWTKGNHCRTLAEALGGEGARRAEADLVASCIKAGALVVTTGDVVPGGMV